MSKGTPGQKVDLLADLTFSQREAVMHGKGPLLILAGAGSGKTRVITRRVAYLLQQGVKPYHILAITFTNKAAGEMRQRVDHLVPGNDVWICTFHSLGARLLRQNAQLLKIDRNFTIYDMQDRNKLIKDALDQAGIDNVRFTPERIGGAISKAKNLLQTPDDYVKQSNEDFFTQIVAKIYAVYDRRLRDANAMDFDDLLYLPALALKRDEDLRAELDARFQYILIDEYQDTNTAQYEMARRLSVDHPNLCVVGDPDQSIYGWRGSDIKNILSFERDFPGTNVITLDKNYRSTKNILHAASVLIDHNLQRKKKSLLTDNVDGEKVRILTFDTGLDEADLVVKRIREEVQSGKRRYRDYAIFFRINALSRTLESAFVKHGVPFQIVKGLAFFERKENRDVLAYLRLLINPSDNLSFMRAVNEPSRGVGKVSLEHLQRHAEMHGTPNLMACVDLKKIPAIKGKAVKGLKDFYDLMTMLRTGINNPPHEVIRAVIDESGYRSMLKFSGDQDDQERLANIEEMITAAQQFWEGDTSRTIVDFLEHITLSSDADAWDESQDCVAVMTLHTAKGLEFPIVYILAMEQGVLPHERSLGRDPEVEEERRLCFVGMTRAKEELYLCNAKLREFRGQALYTVPSMFLDELPEDAIETLDLCSYSVANSALDHWRGGGGSGAADSGWEDTGIAPRKPGSHHPTPISPTPPKPDSRGFAVGVMVEHETYGRGIITELSGFGALRKIRIRFAASGEKIFIVDKVKLTIVPKAK